MNNLLLIDKNNKACRHHLNYNVLTLSILPCMVFRYVYVEAGGLCDAQFMADAELVRYAILFLPCKSYYYYTLADE